MKVISGIYKITNAITGDFYIGSSKNIKRRWAVHKCQSKWNECPNNPLYIDMRKYGIDKFEFEILEEVEIDSLKKTEQQFIETLKPTYNNYNAKGVDIERKKETKRKADKEYKKSNKGKESLKKAQNKYNKSEKGKEYQKKYNKSDKRKEYKKEYDNQLCLYEGETLTLHALAQRFWRRGIDHPQIEAKKYLIKN